MHAPPTFLGDRGYNPYSLLVFLKTCSDKYIQVNFDEINALFHQLNQNETTGCHGFTHFVDQIKVAAKNEFLFGKF